MAPSRCRRPAAQVSNRDVPESCGIDPKCRRRSDAQVDQDSGAGDEVIMSIAGHVSRAMLSRYSHVRMEAKRRALDEIAARQRAADAKRQKEAERQQQAAVVSEDVVVQ